MAQPLTVHLNSVAIVSLDVCCRQARGAEEPQEFLSTTATPAGLKISLAPLEAFPQPLISAELLANPQVGGGRDNARPLCRHSQG